MLKFEDYISDIPDVPYDNFAQMLDNQAREFANVDFIRYRAGKQREFTRWSYSKFGEECRRIAKGLLSAGISKGDRVVLWSENRPEWMAVWMGTVIAGICIVPVDFLCTEQECLNIIKITSRDGRGRLLLHYLLTVFPWRCPSASARKPKTLPRDKKPNMTRLALTPTCNPCLRLAVYRLMIRVL